MAVKDAINYHLNDREPDLAGQTVAKNGFNVTYNENGYPTEATRIGFNGTTSAPSIDAVRSGGSDGGGSGGSGVDRASLGGSVYDRQVMSNADLANIQLYREAAQRGGISWSEANAYAESVRAKYGYAGGSDGSQYIPLAGGSGGSGGSGTGGSAAPSADPAYEQRRTQLREQAERQKETDALIEQYKSLYEQTQGMYAKLLEEQRKAQEAAVRQAVEGLESSRTAADASYADLFRQLYIDKMKSKRDIAQRLAAGGVTGGAAESTLLDLDARYEDALRQGEQKRLDALGGIDRAIADAKLSGGVEGARAAAETARESAKGYADMLKTLINRQDTLDARAATAARDAAAAAREEEAAARKASAEERGYAYQTAMRLLNDGYLPDGELLRSAGIDSASAEAIVARARTAREEAATAREKPQLTAAQVNAAIKNGIITAAVLEAYEYYYGEPYRG